MHDPDNIVSQQKSMQERVFRLAQRDHGLTLKAISLDAGLGYTTVQSYAGGHAVMSIASLYRLVGVIPDELLSLLLPDGHLIVAQSENTDHDEFAAKCIELVTQTAAAHRPDSECAEKIGPNEHKSLNATRAHLRAVS